MTLMVMKCGAGGQGVQMGNVLVYAMHSQMQFLIRYFEAGILYLPGSAWTLDIHIADWITIFR